MTSTIAPAASAADAKYPPLPPPIQLSIGSIVMLRMTGHSRTAGQEYFAPAVVLNQYQPHGELEVLVWDSTAGAHFNPNYPVRDLESYGEGNERHLREKRSNIQAVLFAPERFASMSDDMDRIITLFVEQSKKIEVCHTDMERLMLKIASLEEMMTAPAAQQITKQESEKTVQSSGKR